MKEIIELTKNLVRDWHIAFNVEPPTNEQEAKDFWKLRTKLFIEEHDEYLEEIKLGKDDRESTIGKADAIGDMLVITAGTLDLIERSEEGVKKLLLQMMGQLINEWVEQIHLYLKITKNRVIAENLDSIIEEIMKSNMSKLDSKGRSIINGVSIFDGSNKTIYDIEHKEGEVILTDDKPVGKVIKSVNFVEPNLEEILFPKTRIVKMSDYR